MKILSLFNNKGGVGKTTLTYHLAHILAETVENGGCGKRVLLMDLDPQSNLTIFAMREERVQEIWEKESAFMDNGEGYQKAKNKISKEDFTTLINEPRTLHFLLKPTEEGISDEETLPPPFQLNAHNTLGIIAGRLSLYKYEATIAQRWSGAYLGEPLAIRTITKIRNLAKMYAEKYDYDYVIMDTSPSLGLLNKVIISMADGFIIPCFPDIFSLYGIKNIGDSLKYWEKEFMTMANLLSKENTKDFPNNFVQFLGYTIFNAVKYDGQNEWSLSKAHYDFAIQFPEVIEQSILTNKPIPDKIARLPIGETAIMHRHNAFPAQAQKYKCPMWELPNQELEEEDKSTIKGNKKKYIDIKPAYNKFATDLLNRVSYLDNNKNNA